MPCVTFYTQPTKKGVKMPTRKWSLHWECTSCGHTFMGMRLVEAGEVIFDAEAAEAEALCPRCNAKKCRVRNVIPIKGDVSPAEIQIRAYESHQVRFGGIRS